MISKIYNSDFIYLPLGYRKGKSKKKINKIHNQIKGLKKFMKTLYQYCNHCKQNRNFNPTTLHCLKCNKKNKV